MHSTCKHSNSYILLFSLWDSANVFGTREGLDGDSLTTGSPLAEPPLIDMISNDPVLCGVKVLLGKNASIHY